MLTLMLVAPSTTWLLVRTSPAGVRMMPVPAAEPEPLPVTIWVLMSTTKRSTLAVIACRLRLPLGCAADAWPSVLWGTPAIGACTVEGADALERARLQPTPMPPIRPIRQIATPVPNSRRIPVAGRVGAGSIPGGGRLLPSGVGMTSQP